MVSDDVDAGSKVRFFCFNFCTKKADSALRIENVSYYRNMFLISVVDFMDKERNDNQMIKYSIKLTEKDYNDDKLYEELTTIVHHNWNSDLVALYLCKIL